MNLSSGTRDVLEAGKHANTKCDFGSLIGSVILLFNLRKKGIGKKFYFALGTLLVLSSLMESDPSEFLE